MPQVAQRSARVGTGLCAVECGGQAAAVPAEELGAAGTAAPTARAPQRDPAVKGEAGRRRAFRFSSLAAGS